MKISFRSLHAKKNDRIPTKLAPISNKWFNLYKMVLQMGNWGYGYNPRTPI